MESRILPWFWCTSTQELYSKKILGDQVFIYREIDRNTNLYAKKIANVEKKKKN